MFACLCLNKPEPTKQDKKQKEATTTKKQQKATYNRLAPSIIIINY
jgi:hypothetical protein